MNISINNIEYKFEKGYRTNEKLRESLDVLAKTNFGGLSFKKFYDLGFWTDNIIPYTLFCGLKAVSNLLVCVLDINDNGQMKKYVQLATVMTDVDSRNCGLLRYLIELAISEWKDKCDAIFLFANDTVLKFYPKFGFVKETEYEYNTIATHKESRKRKLLMESSEDRELLIKKVKQGNPFAAFSICSHEYAMFNCTMFYTDCIYYCEDFDVVVVYKEDSGKMYCYDVFGSTQCDLADILSIVAKEQEQNIFLGFTPAKADGFTVNLFEEEDTTLFVLNGGENIFNKDKVKFPVLSHT